MSLKKISNINWIRISMGIIFTALIITFFNHWQKPNIIHKNVAIERAREFAKSLNFEYSNFSYKEGPDSSEFDRELNSENLILYDKFQEPGFLSALRDRGLSHLFFKFRFFTSEKNEELVVFINLDGKVSSFYFIDNKLNGTKDFDNLPGSIKKLKFNPEKLALNQLEQFAKDRNLSLKDYKKISETKNSNEYIYTFESTYDIKGVENIIKISVKDDRVISFASSLPLYNNEFQKLTNNLKSWRELAYSFHWLFGFSILILSIIFSIISIMKGFFPLRTTIIIISTLYIFIALELFGNFLSLSSYSYFEFFSIFYYKLSAVFQLLAILFNILWDKKVFLIIGGLYLNKITFPKAVSFGSIFRARYIASKHFLSTFYLSLFLALAKILMLISLTEIRKFIGWQVSSPFKQMLHPENIFSILSYINISLTAGIFEEIAYRVIPISIAFLLAKRYPKFRKVIILSAIFIQVIFFGLDHIGYISNPFYVRVVELILPSIFYALIYIKFGLITAILTHYIYDYIIFMAGFYSLSKSMGQARLWVMVFLFLLPIFLHYIFRSFVKPAIFFNEEEEKIFLKKKQVNRKEISKNVKKIIKIGLISLFIPSLLFFKQPIRKKLDKIKVKEAAREFVEGKGYSFKSDPIIHKRPYKYYFSPLFAPYYYIEDFFLQNNKKDVYDNMVKENYFVEVSFREDRQFANLLIDNNFEVKYFTFFSNNKKKKSISLKKAKAIAFKYIKEKFNEDDIKLAKIIYDKKYSDQIALNYLLNENRVISLTLLGDEIISIKSDYFTSDKDTIRFAMIRNVQKLVFTFSSFLIIFYILSYLILVGLNSKLKKIKIGRGRILLIVTLVILFVSNKILGIYQDIEKPVKGLFFSILNMELLNNIGLLLISGAILFILLSFLKERKIKFRLTSYIALLSFVFSMKVASRYFKVILNRKDPFPFFKYSPKASFLLTDILIIISLYLIIKAANHFEKSSFIIAILLSILITLKGFIFLSLFNIITIIFIFSLLIYLVYISLLREEPRNIFLLFLILPIINGGRIFDLLDLGSAIVYSIYFISSIICYFIFSKWEN